MLDYECHYAYIRHDKLDAVDLGHLYLSVGMMVYVKALEPDTEKIGPFEVMSIILEPEYENCCCWLADKSDPDTWFPTAFSRIITE